MLVEVAGVPRGAAVVPGAAGVGGGVPGTTVMEVRVEGAGAEVSGGKVDAGGDGGEGEDGVAGAEGDAGTGGVSEVVSGAGGAEDGAGAPDVAGGAGVGCVSAGDEGGATVEGAALELGQLE